MLFFSPFMHEFLIISTPILLANLRFHLLLPVALSNPKCALKVGIQSNSRVSLLFYDRPGATYVCHRLIQKGERCVPAAGLPPAAWAVAASQAR